MAKAGECPHGVRGSAERGKREAWLLPHVEADEIAAGIAGVNAAIEKNGGGPAFAAENLGAGNRFKGFGGDVGRS